MRVDVPALAAWLLLGLQMGAAPGDDVYMRPGQSGVAADGARLNLYCSELEQMSWDEAWLQQHHRSLGSAPVRVLTTGNHGVHFLPGTTSPDPKAVEYQHQIEQAQARAGWICPRTQSRFSCRTAQSISSSISPTRW